MAAFVQIAHLLMRLALVLVILVASSPASAESGEPVEPAPQPQLRRTRSDATPLAVAINNPIMMQALRAVAVSGYVGLSNHHAIRVNVARYRYAKDGTEILAAFAGGEYEGSHDGSFTDLGVAWTYFSRRLWDGPIVEAGILYRHADIQTKFEGEDETTRSHTLAGRVMVGWSWLFYDRLFLAVAAGASLGAERGAGETAREFMPLVNHDISRRTASFESYFRLGLRFGR